MPRGPKAVALALTETERAELRRRLRRRGVGQALARRIRVVLACAEPGATNLGVAEALGVSRQTVATWRGRVAAQRLEGLRDAPRSGAPRSIEAEAVERLVALTLAAPPRGATHWSTRALVLCVEEKPQSRAAQGTAPAVPMRPGQAERHTHDHRRHGTLDLSAARDVTAGTVIGACKRRHRSGEFRAFLDQVEQSVPKGLEAPLVPDNLKTHKTRLIHDWLVKRPHVHLHFTPPARPGSTWSSAGSHS